jgi:DNA-binding MarR family transcriptional regulator
VVNTRWLSDVEQRAWRSWIDASRRIEVALDRQLKDDHGLSIDDYEVMVRISEVGDDGMRMSDLATSVANSPSRLSQRIDRMVQRGLICREGSADDGRVALACLTDEGRARLEAAAPDHVEEARRQFIDRLTPDQVECLAEILPLLLDDPPLR